MLPADYDFICALLKDQSGLFLPADKQYLVKSRLLPVAKGAGLPDVTSLIQRLKVRSDTVLRDAVVDAMTTNESFFFRDKLPFEHFNACIMPNLLARRAATRSIRIWCAAASTGQEPYSLAICLKEMREKLHGWRIEIVGTDISTQALERAIQGRYSSFEVQRGLPIQMLVKYFTQTGDQWEIAQDIKSMVSFRKFNLLHSYASLGQFDVVFCRNVLIYFDPRTKTDVLNRIAGVMKPDGYLLLGAAETIVGLTDSFRTMTDRRGLYEVNSDHTAMGRVARL